jgi:hypothetical protein
MLKENIVHVFGHGLGADQLKALGARNILFHAASLPQHFRSISWQRQVNTGEELILQGSYYNNSSKPVKLLLQGFSTNLDSANVMPGETSAFRLRTVPKQLGRAVYSLIVLDGADTLHHEKVPFEVTDVKPLNILALAASPDFENKFLKNWLFSRRYGITIRTLISANKYIRESLNMPVLKSDRITPALLNNFDLVVGDASALKKLSTGELDHLRLAVEQRGLGMIVRADSITSSTLFFNRGFKIIQSAVSNKQQVHLQTADSSRLFPALILERPNHIEPTPLNRPLVHDPTAHAYAASHLAGAGKIVYTTLANTYSWVLAGDTAAYRHYWSELVSEAAKTVTAANSFTIRPQVPITDFPVELRVETTDSIPFTMQVNDGTVAMQQDYRLPFYWTGIYWPRKTGWQRSAKDGDVYYWYVFDKNDWKDIRAFERTSLNQTYNSRVHSTIDRHESATSIIKKEIPKVYFFIMFLICCVYLWIEEKFYNTNP